MTTVPESHRDLLQAQVAILATLGPNGAPQSTALWFLAEDDDTIGLSLNTLRQKTKNLQRNPAFSLMIIDPASPYRYIEFRGTAVVEPDDDYTFADKLGAKYGANLRERDQPGETRVQVTLPLTKVVTWG
jgi:PPOX class probable F420-dependent enzyme